MAHNKLKRLIDSDDKLKLAVGRILLGNAGGYASAVSMLGDLLIGSAGSMTVQASAVTAGKLKYTALSITIVGSTAGSTSAYGVQAITTGAILLGVWLNGFTSITDFATSFVWYASRATNSVRIDLNGPNPKPPGGTYVWKGVILEP